MGVVMVVGGELFDLDPGQVTHLGRTARKQDEMAVDPNIIEGEVVSRVDVGRSGLRTAVQAGSAWLDPGDEFWEVWQDGDELVIGSAREVDGGD